MFDPKLTTLKLILNPPSHYDKAAIANAPLILSDKGCLRSQIEFFQPFAMNSGN